MRPYAVTIRISPLTGMDPFAFRTAGVKFALVTGSIFIMAQSFRYSPTPPKKSFALSFLKLVWTMMSLTIFLHSAPRYVVPKTIDPTCTRVLYWKESVEKQEESLE